MNTLALELIFVSVVSSLGCWSLLSWLQHRRGPAREKCFHHANAAEPPRLGGIGLAGAFIVTAVFANAFGLSSVRDNLAAMTCLAMFAVGLVDDLRPIGAKAKLAAQMVVALGAYSGGLRIEVLTNPLTGLTMDLGIWTMPVTLCWIVALTNLINLIDGIDGLTGGICFMLMCLLAYAGFRAGAGHGFSTLVSTSMAAALLAFLRFNFPPAKIYMGDGGAYFLGCLIAVLTISTSNKGTIAAGLIAPLVALAVPIMDVTLAIGRRAIAGLPIFRADTKHIHHKLVQAGLSRRRAVLILYAASILCGAIALAVFCWQGRATAILLGALSLLIIVPFRTTILSQLKLAHASSQLRKDSRFALVMTAWLELEAERCATLQDLWTTYLFLTRKLGFSQVRLVLEASTDFFWRDERVAPGQRQVRREMDLGNIRAIEFAADRVQMSDQKFQHLAELAAEMWLKAARRWKAVNDKPISFAPAIPQIRPIVDSGHVWVANAA